MQFLFTQIYCSLSIFREINHINSALIEKHLKEFSKTALIFFIEF